MTLEQEFEKRAAEIRWAAKLDKEVSDLIINGVLVSVFGALGIGIVIWRLTSK